jgi:hypothetical protein
MGESKERVMQPHPVAAGVAAAVALREPRVLAAALTETVRLRALLPGAAIVAHGSADVAACFHGWFADFDTVEVLESAGEAVADRLLIHYRLALIQRETRWVCTHTAICTVVDGRPAVIDLLCSGFHETSLMITPPTTCYAGHRSPPRPKNADRPVRDLVHGQAGDAARRL